ncbi:MAG: T9SS type A sorting domain-containing protein [Candidatus Micrarchaeaceae archaeon]
MDPRKQHPDSSYILHSVPKMSYYTSQTAVPDVYSGFSSMSFYTLMQHEIGHILGLTHPDQVDGSGDTCSNCYTQNPSWSTDTAGRDVFHPAGYVTIMQPIINNGLPPMQLSDEDRCQFQKLYCPPACGPSNGGCALTAGVSEQNFPQDLIHPEVFPNPTNNGMTLNFRVPQRGFVQVLIFDVLGNRVRLVTSRYMDVSSQAISLGTEFLPSGHYVCRVQVGDVVQDINVVIER